MGLPQGVHCGCAIERLELGPPGSLLVVAAHPDDETIGLGATLGTLAACGWRVAVVHATDGAPRDRGLRPTLAALTRDSAAAVRRDEAEEALRVGGLDPAVTLCDSIGISDQEAALSLVALTRALRERLRELAPDIVVTQPYEGGHPDHDAVAFAVHAARSSEPRAPRIAEMSAYHAASGALSTGTFCTAGPCPRFRAGLLGAMERRRRRAMLDAFRTQREILAPFGDDAEPLRCAPRYDFTRPPHAGALYYERLPFGWTGEGWRALAARAQGELGVPP